MELRNEKESFMEGLQKWMDKLPFKKKKKVSGISKEHL